MRLIDADAYKQTIMNMLPEHQGNDDIVNTVGTTIYGCISALDDAPTIEPESLQPQWIPFLWRKTTKEDGWDPEEFPLTACGELPENGQDILVTNGCHVWSDTFFDDDDLYLDSGNDLVEDVTAWMPLPTPVFRLVDEEEDT